MLSGEGASNQYFRTRYRPLFLPADTAQDNSAVSTTSMTLDIQVAMMKAETLNVSADLITSYLRRQSQSYYI